jgi:hypothetical protein
MAAFDTRNFKVGDRVGYLFQRGEMPELGTVTSINLHYVFVQFDKYPAQENTSHACNPGDLRKIS